MAAVLALRAQVEEQRCYATNFKDDQNNINALPREMLVRIMQKLPVGCAATLASVCQTWQRAAEDSGLWRYWCMDDWACTIRWSVVDEVTEDFLEEYGWKRLYRQIGELGKSETVMTTQSHDLRENARVVRERLERNRSMVSSRVGDLKSLNRDERALLASLKCDAATEAIGCAIMILVRQEPAWEEAMRHAAGDTLISKAVACDPDQWTPGMIHRVSRLTARPEFQDVIATQRENGETNPRALGLAAEWVLACQHFATVARELVPKQELVDRAQKSLPDRIREYEDARSALEEVIGNECMLSAIPPAASTPTK